MLGVMRAGCLAASDYAQLQALRLWYRSGRESRATDGICIT